MDWLADNAWAAWLALALALAAIETTTADLVFLMFAGGAAAAAAGAGLGAGLVVQVISFAVVSLLLLGIVRPEIRKRLLGADPDVPMGVRALHGAQARVTSPVDAHGGRIRLHGEEWSARLAESGVPLMEGALVTVVAVEGATALVKPQDAAPPVPPSIGE